MPTSLLILQKIIVLQFVKYNGFIVTSDQSGIPRKSNTERCVFKDRLMYLNTEFCLSRHPRVSHGRLELLRFLRC